MQRTQKEGSFAYNRPDCKTNNDFNMKTPKNISLINRLRSPANAVKRPIYSRSDLFPRPKLLEILSELEKEKDQLQKIDELDDLQ